MIQSIVLCKTPIPGRVKTRLQPQFSAEQAADLHAAMAKVVIDRALRLFPQSWIAAEDAHHPFFRQWQARILPQGTGNLGDRMIRLMHRAFAHGAKGVLFLGTDSPHMPEARLHYSLRYLRSHDVVIGPVEDGGYDLIACAGPYEDVFRDISWGTHEVLGQTLERVRTLGLNERLLSMGFDVDTPAALLRAIRSGFCVSEDQMQWIRAVQNNV